MMTKLRWIFSVGLMLGWTAAASAQITDKPWGYLSLSPAPKEAPSGAPPLDLRANTKQVLHLIVVNPTEDTPVVTITVSAGNKTVATGEARIAGKGLQRVVLNPAAVAPAIPGTPPASDAGTLILPDASTGKMQLSVAVANKNRTDEPANVGVQSVLIKNPSTYLGPSSAVFIGATNQLTVNVSATDLTGPPAPVELVLDPQDIPGLEKGELKGLIRGTLTEQQKELTLFAADLAITPGAEGIGRVTLTVDGVERAVVLKGSFKIQAGGRSDKFVPDLDPSLRIIAPAAARPGQEITAHIEAANLPDDSRLTFTFVPASGSGPVSGPTITRNSPRDQWAAAKVDEGVLAVTTVSKEWTFKLDTRGMYGPYTLNVVATTGASVKPAVSTIIFDDTPPKDVHFLPGDPMKPPVKGRTTDVRITCADNDSQISKVEFFVGIEPPAPSPDGKEPAAGPKPTLGVMGPKEPGGPFWGAKIPLPDKTGPTPVFVRVTNGVGLHTIEKMELTVVDPPLGGVKGQVKYGDQTQLQDVTIWIVSKDGKTTLKDAMVINDGYFYLKDIPPGEYQLIARRKVSAKPLFGTIPITVKEGPELTPALIILKQTP